MMSEVLGRLSLFQDRKRGGGDLGGLFWFSPMSYKNAIYFSVRRKDYCRVYVLLPLHGIG